jgi:aspartyl-tRNA(Asn)/glutamyl-tRNA(Gln) amidotransferase subunit C
MGTTQDMNIDYVANLARLELTPEEKALYANQLGDILHYFERLSAVDVTDVEPMAHAMPVFNVWQADKKNPLFPVEDLLNCVPEQREQQLVVPKVVDDA